ncbi:MAG: CPBP family intramembrane metalloprotease [Treponema sp.]|jgi:membrane protease YdiL (CAAX protease family)|nr:CPBP family intramembrane metalloprotease [Treponema sp.]
MNAYFEALILYMVLFLPGGAGRMEGLTGFSIPAELTRIFLFNIPSLALIWYLLLKMKGFKDWGIGPPRKNDLLAAVICLPGLLLTAFIIALISPYFGESSGQTMFYPPSSVPLWIILGVSCISTGYLEESFFRFYLLSKREELRLSDAAALLVSVAAFSICHIYEGPWGFLNSVISGILLSFAFLRWKSLHGIALAHGLYNMIVIIVNTLSAAR